MEPEVNAPSQPSNTNVTSTEPPLANDNQTTMANPSLPTNPPSVSNEPPSYPPYNLEHVVSYTDQQILYYIRTNQIPDRQAFLRAKQERDEFFHQVGITDGEPTQFTSVSIPAPVLPTSVSIEWTLEDDGEPDIDFPQPVPGEKGVKIDRLTILRHDGGLVNYHNWLSDVTRAFKADPARFNAAVKRVVFATSWFDQKMKSIWVGESKKRPHLEDHWLKFLRWIDKTHLHGDSDLIYQLNQYQDAMQGPNEEPTAFYSRLTTLSYAAQTSVGHKDFLARLTPSLKADLAMVHRTGSTVDELLANAQEVWAAQRLRRKAASIPTYSIPTTTSGNQTRYSNQSRISSYQSNQRATPNDPSTPSKPFTSPYQASPFPPDSSQTSTAPSKLSDEERQHRTENNLCFNCGLSGHIKKFCNQYRRGIKRPAPIRSQPILADDDPNQGMDSDNDTRPSKRSKN
ncbi:hypothetical protein V8E54_005303 [Elaphomyces granulatus]